MNTKEIIVYWNKKPIGVLESPKVDMFEIYGKWNPYRSIHHLNFIESLTENEEPLLEVDSIEPQSRIKCYLVNIDEGEIFLKVYPSTDSVK